MIATEKAKERIKHFRSNVTKPRLQSQTSEDRATITPTAPQNITPSSNQYRETHVQTPNSSPPRRQQSTNSPPQRQQSTVDLPPPYAEIQPPTNPYFNDNVLNSSTTQIEPNTMHHNSSFNGNITSGSTNNNNNNSVLNDSQTSNSHALNYNYSSNNCSTLSSSSFIQSSTNDNSANTSLGHRRVQSHSLYPNLNVSQGCYEASPTDNTSSSPNPQYEQHLNELRYSVNRLSLGHDQF